MKKMLLVSALLLGVSFGVSAQSRLHFRVDAGAKMSSLEVFNRGSVYSTAYQLGGHGGVAVEYALKQGFYASSGLYYSSIGGKSNQDAGDKKSTSHVMMHSINVPIHIGHRTEFGQWGLAFEFGPYIGARVGGVSVGFSGEIADYYRSDDKSDFEEVINNGFSRFDAGLGMSVALEYNRLSLRFGYDQGLLPHNKGEEKGDDLDAAIANLTDDYTFSNDVPRLRNRGMYVTLGYRF